MKQALNLLKKIEEHGFQAYLIGGFPRDHYLKRESQEIDLCTSAVCEELSTFLTVKERGYGSMLIEEDGKIYETTTFRKEEGTIDHRHPFHVKMVDTLEEDLKRRDFTINTLAIDSKGEYVDLLNARVDLDAKILRTVGDPFQKLEEDALRILRAIRFAVILDFEFDPLLEQAIFAKKKLIRTLSIERIRSELKKMIEANSKQTIFYLKKFQLQNILKVSLTNLTENNWLSFLFWNDTNLLYAQNKKERCFLKEARQLSKKEITPLFLYHHDTSFYQAYDALFQTSLLEKYQALPIHRRNEINLSEIDKERYQSKLSTLYPILEEQILTRTLVNDEKSIHQALEALERKKTHIL